MEQTLIEGMFTARMLHAMLYDCPKADAPILCYFQPVGEGAVDVLPDRAVLSADGQAFSLLKAHKGGELCRIEGLNDCEAVASLRDGVLSVSLLNERFDETAQYALSCAGSLIEARLLEASDLLPGSHFDEREAKVAAENGSFRVSMPPRSAALLRFRMQ